MGYHKTPWFLLTKDELHNSIQDLKNNPITIPIGVTRQNEQPQFNPGANRFFISK